METTTKNCKTEKLKSKTGNRKSLGNHVVSPEEEKEKLQWEGLAEKECFKSGMRVGDEKLIIISVAVRGINDHIRVKCFAQLPSTPRTRQEHRPVPPNANPAVWILIRVVV